MLAAIRRCDGGERDAHARWSTSDITESEGATKSPVSSYSTLRRALKQGGYDGRDPSARRGQQGASELSRFRRDDACCCTVWNNRLSGRTKQRQAGRVGDGVGGQCFVWPTEADRRRRLER